MRWLFPLALAAALAGCTVDTEGAACSTPGLPDGCPGGQRCGAGRTCSAAATRCEVCTPGVLACRDDAVKRCSAAADPVCGSWVVEDDCPAAGLACPDGAPVGCACPAHVESPVVRRVDLGAGTRPGLTRNGATASVCRYLTLGDALGDAAAGDQVMAMGYVDQPVVFTEGPLTIPAGVAVVTADSTPVAANYVVEVAGAGTEAVRLGVGASLSGITLRRGTDGPTLGVLVEGASPTSGPSMASVRVEGGTPGPFVKGVRIAGAGAVLLDGLVVIGATDGAGGGVGLEVERDGLAETVSVTGGVFGQGDVGVRLLVGDLSLTGPTVSGNTGVGVEARPPAGQSTAVRSLTVEEGTISRNGAGLTVSLAQRLVLKNNNVCGNSGIARSVYASSRKVGGLYGVGKATSEFSLQGNRFHGNGGDQVLVYLASVPWDFSGVGGSCAPADRNVFSGYATVDVGNGTGVGLAAFGAPVVARHASWSSVLPELGIDFLQSDGGSVNAGTAEDPLAICPRPDPSELACP